MEELQITFTAAELFRFIRRHHKIDKEEMVVSITYELMEQYCGLKLAEESPTCSWCRKVYTPTKEMPEHCSEHCERRDRIEEKRNGHH
jgi:hypothetical protein